MSIQCIFCCQENFSTKLDYFAHVLHIFKQLSQCPICLVQFNKASQFVLHFENNGCHYREEEEIEEEEEDNQDDIEIVEQYFCQVCNLSIEDVQLHLEQFHNEEETVLLENDKSDEITELPPQIPLDLEPKKIAKQKTTEQDCKDKEGRNYRRKYVKIDKFWLDNDNNEKLNENQCKNCRSIITKDEIHECSVQTTKTIITKKSKKNAGCSSKYRCAVCNTDFSSYKSVRLHERMHDNKLYSKSSKDNYFCHICEKFFSKEFQNVHKLTHKDDNWICTICNRRFTTKQSLDMHKKAHNTNNKKFSCSYCKKLFLTYNALNEHMLNQCHKREYVCQFCGRRFARPHEKVKHERIHTGEKPHVCTICGKAFRVMYCLTQHLRTHSNTRPYQCEHCLKRFRSNSVYRHHLLLHSDEKNFKCPFCPKAFKTSVQLAGHKNSHTKPFNCTICNRPFASLYSVKTHMETHKKDNNLKYECNICGALYSRSFALNDHLQYYHGAECTSRNKEADGKDKQILLEDSNVVLNSQLEDQDVDNEISATDG